MFSSPLGLNGEAFSNGECVLDLHYSMPKRGVISPDVKC